MSYQTPLPQSSPFPLGDPCEGPRGWQGLHKAYWRGKWPVQLVLTPEAWTALCEAREGLAWEFVPEPPGRDAWNPRAGGKGDCEDWCLAMRLAFTFAEFPRDAFRVAVCRIEDGRDHAVLAIATDRGELIADVRRFPEIVPWTELPYQWIAVEGPAGQWRSIGRTLAMLAGSP